MEPGDLLSRTGQSALRAAARESDLSDAKKFRGKAIQRVPIDLNLLGSINKPLNISFPFDAIEIIASTDSTGANNFSQYIKFVPGSRDTYNMNNYRECRLGEVIEFDTTQLEAQIYADAAQAGCNMTVLFYLSTKARSSAINARITGFLSQTDGSTLNTALLGSAENASSVACGVVGSAAVQILKADSSRSLAELYVSGGSVMIGDSAVIATTGVPRQDGERWENRSTGALYAITISGNPTITGVVNLA